MTCGGRPSLGYDAPRRNGRRFRLRSQMWVGLESQILKKKFRDVVKRFEWNKTRTTRELDINSPLSKFVHQPVDANDFCLWVRIGVL